MARFEIYRKRALEALEKANMTSKELLANEINNTFDFVKLLKMALQLESMI